MSTISSAGIGSGLDVTSIVSQLVALEKKPLTALATKATALQSKISSFATVQSQVASLTDVASRIALTTAWSARNASSSNTSAATVTATSTADATSFTLDVDRLATQQSVSSPTVTAGSTPGAGTLKLRLGSWNTGATAFTSTATSLAGTTVTGYATALADGDVTINGTSIGAISATITASARGQQISDAINAVTGTTGVAASYNSVSGAVTLTSANGNDIVLATTTNATSAATGLGASGTVSADVSIAVASTDTVSAIAAKINAANAGVQATAFNDGTLDRLLLRSKTTGTAAGFRIQSADSVLSNFVFDPGTPATATSGMASASAGTPVYAVDAKARINGLVVTSGSNTLTGNIPGVTIKLLSTTTTNYGTVSEVKNPATLSVSEDVTPAVRNVSDFVTAYNNLNTTLVALTKYDAATKTGGPFQGDASVVGLQNVLRSMVGSSSLGATTQYLSDVGLQMQADGSLTINNAKLTVAANNGTSMQKLFTNDNGNALTNGFALKFKNLGKGFLAAGGSVTSKATALQAQLDRNAADQAKVTARATTVETQLKARYSALDGQMGSLTALSNYVNQQVTLWNKNTA
jgi:flagellar hook-associated protein 2